MSIVGKINYGVGAKTIRREFVALQAQITCISLLSLWIYAFWPTLKSMYFTYNNSAMEQHCLIIPYIFLGLVLFKKRSLERLQPNSSFLGLAILLILSLSWMFSLVFGYVVLQQLFMIAMIPAIFLLSSGTKITRTLLFPLFILFFLLPIGNAIGPIFNKITNKLLVGSFVFSNIPLYWDASSIKVLHSNIGLQNITQGLNYIIGFLIFGMIYSYIISLNFIRSAVVALACVVFPYVFLLLGVHLTARLELLSGYELFYFFGEKKLGWTFIILSLLCCISLGWQLRQQHRRSSGMENFNWELNVTNSNYKWFKITIISIAILLMIPWATKNINENVLTMVAEKINYIAPKINRWEGPLAPDDFNWKPKFSSAIGKSYSSYYLDNKEVYISASFYTSPIISMGLKNDSMKLYDEEKWDHIKISKRKIILAEKNTLKVNEIVLGNSEEHKVIWSWYHVSGSNFTNVNFAGVYDGIRSIANVSTGGSIIAVSSGFNTEIDDARKQLQTFVLDLEPELYKIYQIH